MDIVSIREHGEGNCKKRNLSTGIFNERNKIAKNGIAADQLQQNVIVIDADAENGDVDSVRKTWSQHPVNYFYGDDLSEITEGSVIRRRRNRYRRLRYGKNKPLSKTDKVTGGVARLHELFLDAGGQHFPDMAVARVFDDMLFVGVIFGKPVYNGYFVQYEDGDIGWCSHLALETMFVDEEKGNADEKKGFAKARQIVSNGCGARTLLLPCHV